MRKTAYFGLVAFFIFLTTPKTNAQGLDAYFDYASFYAPGVGTYVETYLAFAGNSLHYILTNDSALEASVEVTMIFKNVDEIKEFRKFKVLSPPLPDTATIFPSFIDLQRIAIPQGIYNFDLIIRDNYAPDSILPFKKSVLLSVDIPTTELSIGGIEFVERYNASTKDNIFVKSGYEYIPFVADYFPKQIDYLRFYTEVYNAANELGPLEDFLVMFHIENYNTSKPIKDFSSFQKQKAQNVNIIFKEISIRNLPTGNYYLVIELRDRENKQRLISKKFFQRQNVAIKQKQIDLTEIEVAHTFVSNFVSKDTLAMYLSALRPICDVSEDRFIDNQLQAGNLRLMQQFFYNFWAIRNESNPEYAWSEYRQYLNIVEQRYANNQNHGFDTDRGRVFLQYGPPNSIIEERNEGGAYPYEIWHYYKIADQTDKKFIFYNKSLLKNDYTLLHSNMKGELSNAVWEDELYSRQGNWNENNVGTKDSKALEYFEGN
jgi:GWxTD domain-containing protein